MGKADREDILSIYKRWELEDFHVVAFTYCPIPISHKHLIVSAACTGGVGAVNSGGNGVNPSPSNEGDAKIRTNSSNWIGEMKVGDVDPYAASTTNATRTQSSPCQQQQ